MKSNAVEKAAEMEYSQTRVVEPEMSTEDMDLNPEIEERRKNNDVNAMIVRTAVNTVYDLQGLRISTGNRVNASFRSQLGGTNPIKNANSDEVDPETKKMLTVLMGEHDMIQKVYADQFNNRGRITKSIETLGEVLEHIHSEPDYMMVDIYMGLLSNEKEAIKLVDNIVKEHPMWDAFFKDVVGCGPLMTAVCLSRLDPYKARHVSSFWKYAGLDVVYEPIQSDDVVTINPEEDPTLAAELGRSGPVNPVIAMHKHLEVHWDDGREPYSADVMDAVEEDDKIVVTVPGLTFSLVKQEKDTVTKPNKRNGLKEPEVTPGARIVSCQITDLPTPTYRDAGRYVGRSRWHLVDVEYTAKDGSIKSKKSLSYNPFLKTKLMGVLADSFIKCPGSKYEQIYRGYRQRLSQMPAHYGKTLLHLHMMAKRYAVKMFLQDMWVTWRRLEGLEVTEPYAVAKLGMNPHGFNY